MGKIVFKQLGARFRGKDIEGGNFWPANGAKASKLCPSRVSGELVKKFTKIGYKNGLIDIKNADCRCS